MGQVMDVIIWQCCLSLGVDRKEILRQPAAGAPLGCPRGQRMIMRWLVGANLADSLTAVAVLPTLPLVLRWL